MYTEVSVTDKREGQNHDFREDTCTDLFSVSALIDSTAQQHVLDPLREEWKLSFVSLISVFTALLRHKCMAWRRLFCNYDQRSHSDNVWIYPLETCVLSCSNLTEQTSLFLVSQFTQGVSPHRDLTFLRDFPN